MRTFKMIFKIKSRLSVRETGMVIFTLCMPMIMVFILDIISEDRPTYQEALYIFLEQSFGTSSTIAVCVGGVMSLPPLVSDCRQKHTLKRFRITFVSLVMILAVYVTIYTAYSLVSLVLVCVSAAFLFGYRMQGSPAAFLLCCVLAILSTFNTDTAAEGIVLDMKLANVAASVLCFPMLISSGATLPYEVVPELMQRAVGLMSLTQRIKLLEVVLSSQEPVTVWIPMAAITDVFLLCSCISLRFFKWE